MKINWKKLLIYLVLSSLAYGIVLLQATVLSIWPLFGSQPHLIALTSLVFLVFNRPSWGLGCILVGSGLMDLWLPAWLGITLGPLLIAYGLVWWVFKKIINNLPWWALTLLGALMVAISEAWIVLLWGEWKQFSHDILVSALIGAPIFYWATQHRQMFNRGFKLEGSSL